VLPALRERTLDLLSERDHQARHARKLFKEAFALFRQAGRWTRGKPEPGSRQTLRREARAMIADARRMEAAATEAVLDSASVLCSTLTGLDDELLGDRRFALVVIDEACQSTEPAAWIALARAGRVVLAGDHRQLPPTVLSTQAARQGFGVSMQERVVGMLGAAVTRRLDVQYRMHERIMAFPSAEMYEGSLVAHPSVAGHLLAGLPGVGDVGIEGPLAFIDTAGAGFDEEKDPGGESRLNRREGELAAAKVRGLIAGGVAGGQIAVIAPYAAQVRLLRRLLADVDGVEIDSVDGFQGREKEAVVISMVRSNPEGELGFLTEIRRTNVALTRARRCLVVIGDSATLARDPFHARLIEYCERVGAYRTVWEEGGA
jgi:predicted DNA helicase